MGAVYDVAHAHAHPYSITNPSEEAACNSSSNDVSVTIVYIFAVVQHGFVRYVVRSSSRGAIPVVLLILPIACEDGCSENVTVYGAQCVVNELQQLPNIGTCCVRTVDIETDN